MIAYLKAVAEKIRKAQAAVSPFEKARLAGEAAAAQQLLNIEFARELESLRARLAKLEGGNHGA